MWIFIGLLVGVVLGVMTNINIPAEYSRYVAIAILASLDSVVGAALATLQKTFDSKIFIAGFFSNALIAAGMTYLGSLLDVDMGIAATIVFGTRIFNNFATLRRLLFSRKTVKKTEINNDTEKS